METQAKKIRQEWEAYDKRYPVLPGAYKPPDYYQQQRTFLERLSAVSDELRALPRTTGEKLKQVLIWVVIIAAIVIAVVVLL